jgi:hypothetical protein
VVGVKSQKQERRSGVIPPPSFSGHETFPFRYAWLKKGVDAVSQNPSIFSDDRALIVLGVGKNMVRSIRHWCFAARLIEEDPNLPSNHGRYLTPTQLGKMIFAERGFDPYLEDPATLWLIHWLIATNSQKATTWYWAFSHWNLSEFTKDMLLRGVQEFVEKSGWKAVSSNSLKRDIDCFIRTYIPSKHGKNMLMEDTLDCPLVELGLISRLSDGQTYSFNRGAHPSLPNSVFAFALLSFWQSHAPERRTLGFEEIAYHPGSPGRVFKLDEDTLVTRLDQLENLTADCLAYDETAGIKQVYQHRDSNRFEILEVYYRANGRVQLKEKGSRYENLLFPL